MRERALFDLGIDSTLRGFDLDALKMGDLISSCEIPGRASFIHRKIVDLSQLEIASDARGRIWL